MLRRVPIRSVGSVADVAAHVAQAAEPTVVIFDADNTLVPQGAAPAEFARLVDEVINDFEAIATVSQVIVLTNGPPRGVDRIVSRGNKPWTTRRRLGLRGARRIVITGDQVLTDGLLAWRFGAEFMHLVIEDEREAKGQALMRRIGGLIGKLLFRPVS